MSQSNPGAKRAGSTRALRAHLRRWWWAWYLGLVLVSHAVELLPADDSSGPRPLVEIPATTRSGAVPDRTIHLSYDHWPVGETATSGSSTDHTPLPIILLHGSPGDSRNFATLAPMLASAGRECFAPDLPGFGESSHWVADYSVRAHAHAVLAMMDALDIERAHLVVWSMGGGVSLNMADLAPDRVASITLMAAIGAQETEGSGEYFFEHAKYALGYLGFVVGGELVPLPWHRERWKRHSWIRNFFDTDQRPLSGIMERLETPTLILQGRHDFFVPYWAAQRHHELIGPSRLVMFNAGHFIPVTEDQAEVAAGWMDRFHTSVELGEGIEGEVNLAPLPVRTWTVARAHELGIWIRSWHWTMQSLLFAALGTIGLTPAIAVAGLLRATEDVNLAVSLVGLLALRVFSRDGPKLCRPHLVVLSGFALWALSFAAWIMGGRVALPMGDRFGGAGLLVGFLLVCLGVHVLRGLWTRENRQRARASLARFFGHEFWPSWIFYTPLAPWLILLSIRHRSPLVFTCVNPGISHGGGVSGESKIDILRSITDAPEVLEAHVIDAGPPPDVRARAALALMQSNPRLREFPIVLKPLAGERGVGVRVVHSPGELSDYMQDNLADTIIQQYHPGPIELGVLWERDPGASPEGLAGRITSITIKEFPSVVGDAKRNLRELILAHRRYRCQADFFLEKLADRCEDVPGMNERVTLSGIGNHAHGAVFRDAAHLITPALTERIDEIARSFQGKGDGPLDFGRFDLRIPSLDDAARGENLAIVELNGAFAESTNLYDPGRSVLWAFGVLFRQWATIYRLGAWRRRQGATPMRARAFVAMIVNHQRSTRAAQAAMLRR